MNRNIRIARELVRIAKELMALSKTDIRNNVYQVLTNPNKRNPAFNTFCNLIQPSSPHSYNKTGAEDDESLGDEPVSI